MANRISTYDTGDIINENESYYVQFRVTDGVAGTAVTVTDAPAVLHVGSSSTQVFSGSARSVISDTNLVKVTLTPADNVFNDSTAAATRGYEDRRLLCDVYYSGGRQAQAFLYRIEYSPVATT